MAAPTQAAALEKRVKQMVLEHIHHQMKTQDDLERKLLDYGLRDKQQLQSDPRFMDCSCLSTVYRGSAGSTGKVWAAKTGPE